MITCDNCGEKEPVEVVQFLFTGEWIMNGHLCASCFKKMIKNFLKLPEPKFEKSTEISREIPEKSTESSERKKLIKTLKPKPGEKITILKTKRRIQPKTPKPLTL